MSSIVICMVWGHVYRSNDIVQPMFHCRNRQAGDPGSGLAGGGSGPRTGRICTCPRGAVGQHRPFLDGLLGFTLADRLGREVSPLLGRRGVLAPGSRSPARARAQARGPRGARSQRPVVGDVRPVPRKVRDLRDAERGLRSPGLRRHLDLAGGGAADRVRDQAAARRPSCARAARRSWPRSRTSCPLLGARLHAVVGLHQEGAAAGRRARRRGGTAPPRCAGRATASSRS